AGLALADDTDPGIASRSCEPEPVTTAGSRMAAAGTIEICTLTEPPGVTVTSWVTEPYPIRLARTRTAPAWTPRNSNVPSARVSSRIGDPGIATSTLKSGCWLVPSSTLPATEPVESWAQSGTTPNKPATNAGTT